MYNQDTLQFFLHILQNMHIPTAIMRKPYTEYRVSDFDIRKITYPQMNFEKYACRFFESCNDHIIYKAFDEFLFSYLILMLQEDTDCSFLVIGPFLTDTMDEADILNKAQEFNISPEVFPHFKKYYEAVPYIPDTSMLFTIVNSYAATLWGSMDDFSMMEISNQSALSTEDKGIVLSSKDAEQQLLALKNVDIRYAAENEFLQMVANGQIHKIEMYLNLIDLTSSEQRHVDNIRNAKNYAIIMNTLLRKTVEHSAVPPIHIDKVSSSFAKKIEFQTSERAIIQLLKEMARKYAFLVKNHSMKGYSALIRRVLTHIDNDLSVDLSLSKLASIVQTNPSYLSTVFKKETGHTLTEYVTAKRIDHAIFLLNSTNMQVQTIASYCGIPDVCYFSKLFKKTTGKTPIEYREYVM